MMDIKDDVNSAGDVEVEYPAGAIHNGRAFADQLESIYAFKEQGEHILSLCSEWQSFVQCFEHLAQSVDDHGAIVTRLTAERDGLRQTIQVIDHHLRGHVNDPDPLVSNAISEGCATTYGLVAGLKRERDELLAEVRRLDRESQNLSSQLGECDRGRRLYRDERDRLQSDLDRAEATLKRSVAVEDYEALLSDMTKARELLAQEEDENTVLRGALKDVLDWIDCSQSSAALRSIAQNALDYSATPIAHNVDESCGQDAETPGMNF